MPSLLQKRKGRVQAKNSESSRVWMSQRTKKHTSVPWSKCERTSYQTFTSCVTLGNSLDPNCLAFIALLSWNPYFILILRQKMLVVVGSLVFFVYIWQYYENFHFQVVHMYAYLGYPNAQHILGQRYLKGAGVEKNEEMAMHWFRQASQQGHPHSSFNLAIGKLKNWTLALEEGEAEMLLGLAADQGLPEAQELLEKIIQARNKL